MILVRIRKDLNDSKSTWFKIKEVKEAGLIFECIDKTGYYKFADTPINRASFEKLVDIINKNYSGEPVLNASDCIKRFGMEKRNAVVVGHGELNNKSLARSLSPEY